MSVTLFDALDDRPRLAHCRVDLRPYQEQAIADVRAKFADGHKSVLLVLPTGTGKTITFGHIARQAIQKDRRVLILAHRRELIQQAVDKLDTIGVEACVEMGERFAREVFEPDCVVATVQTLQRKRLESWPRDHFGLIVTDEAHHATSDSYANIYRYFAGAHHLGVTATADRADEDNLGRVFEAFVEPLSLWDAMTAPAPGPYLCRLKYVQCDVDIDLRDIRTTGGDFNQGDLEERIRPLVEVLANSVKREVGDRRTLIFTPDVGSAQAMATALRSLGLKFDYVSGDDRDRNHKVEALHKGEIQGLANCALLTEGFDCPEISAVVLCRPTKSRPLYSQMVGRGTRLARDKDNCLVVDFNYLTAKHDLVKPCELFDTCEGDPELLAIAGELTDTHEAVDLMDAIKRASEVLEQRKAVRIAVREREVKYRKVEYDPIDAFDALGIGYRAPKGLPAMPASRGQCDLLNKFKIPAPERLSKTQAATLIGQLLPRAKRGLCTWKQSRYLIALGVEPKQARNMTLKQASEAIDFLRQQRSR